MNEFGMPIDKGRGYSPRSGVDKRSRSAIRPAAGWTREADRLFAPQRGGQEEADRLFAPQRGGQEEVDRLFAPQRGGQEKQLCYSPRSAANKRFHFIIRPAADYVTRHLIGQFW